MFAPALVPAVVAGSAALGTATVAAAPTAAAITAAAATSSLAVAGAGAASTAAISTAAAAAAAAAAGGASTAGFLGLSASGWGTLFAAGSSVASGAAGVMEGVAGANQAKEQKNLLSEQAKNDELARRQRLRQGVSALRVGAIAGNIRIDDQGTVQRLEDRSAEVSDLEQSQANMFLRIQKSQLRQRQHSSIYGGIARAGINLGGAAADYFTAAG